ncbi:type I secretion system permease/ATPase [Sphingomonas sp.]|jgi:ATP-binding cassette subfamily C protein|uniref:type I secretion system permease/ATPase n=1 Tax=Sphingomonas sp. TaxID=28214 RepID=UPI002E31AE8F|nr:type I secretion system permease/ATPase [Sphingomonas sp.]HEX4694625.1 type I secretion system permease/ATPase [Sphingomonas sp.]
MARLGNRKDSEILVALRQLRGGLGAIAALSAMVNVLTIAGSLYLMMVYDRVLPSQSLATLFSIFAMIVIAYLFYGVFDVMRTKMLADVASSLDRSLSGRVQLLESRIALERPEARDQISPSRDLDQLRSFIASAGPPALIDLPWIFFFLLVLTLVHYWLGIITLVGMIGLAVLTLVAERVSGRHVAAVTAAASRRRVLGERQWRHAEAIAALGMRDRLMLQWRAAHHAYLDRQATLTDTIATLGGISKVSRMFLQSLVLTVGAILVIDGKATAGIIFASSILSGRAMAPVDQAIANWKNFVAARQSWGRLDNLLGQVPAAAADRTELPAPTRELSVEQVSLAPPGTQRATVAGVSFQVSAGQVVGIIGPSASGKSSLVRGVVGVWKAAAGVVRLDGAALPQWDPEVLGRHIGYLPQSVELFAGTVAENIARFEVDAPSETIIAAAQAAGAHDVIVQLPGGYDCVISEDGMTLSAGQRQRIALARALYRDPFLVVLDEPNSNLDPEGEMALARAVTGVRERGGIVLLVAHRREILGIADLLLVMRAGGMYAFGPRDEVLAKIAPPPGQGNLTPIKRTAG